MYVDDLCIAAQDHKEIINILESKYNLKVKGDGPLTYHLGADYSKTQMGHWYLKQRNILKNYRRPM